MRTILSPLAKLIVPFIDMNAATEARDGDKKQYVFLANLMGQDDNGFAIEMSQDVELETPEQVFESGIWQFGSSALYDFGTKWSNFIAGTKGTGAAV